MYAKGAVGVVGVANLEQSNWHCSPAASIVQSWSKGDLTRARGDLLAMELEVGSEAGITPTRLQNSVGWPEMSWTAAAR